MILFDAVHGAFDAARAPVQGEAGGHGVEVSEQVQCEAGEPGQLAGVDCVDPGRERGAEAAGEYLAEFADVSGGRVQFGTAGQEVLETNAVFIVQGRGVAGDPAGHLPYRRWPCQNGSGEPVAALLRPGNAGSNTASDHIETTRLALAQLPIPLRHGRQTLIRTDSAGGTHAFLDWLSRPDRWLSYSVGMTITDAFHQAVLKIPKKAWTPA